MRYFNIVIDGPADAGRSTIAKLTAKGLGFVYADTGAVYRSMALYSIRQDISPEDEEAVAGACGQAEVAIRYAGGVQQVILNGEDISGLIRSEEVGRMISTTPMYRPVGEKLVQLQEQLAREADVIIDSRDIGTYVLPGAPAKIYLAASMEIRAKRRFRELEKKGTACDIREIERGMEKRDCRDMHQENSPLRQAEDAVLLDSSHMTVEQVVDSIIHIVGERGYEG